jgi:hypothetical protein
LVVVVVVLATMQPQAMAEQVALVDTVLHLAGMVLIETIVTQAAMAAPAQVVKLQ